MDAVEGNLTAFLGCPTSDALEGAASPSLRRTVISSGLYETELTWTSLYITKRERVVQGGGGLETVRLQAYDPNRVNPFIP